MSSLLDITTTDPTEPTRVAGTTAIPRHDDGSRRTDGSATHAPIGLLGGALLALAPLLIIAGNLTCPPQDSGSNTDYLVSLARDPFLTSVSATLYHYGWIAMAFGVLAATGLVRGRRGRALTLIGGLGTAFGAVQLSGLLLNDWWMAAAGNTVPTEQAVAIFETMPDLSVDIWLNSANVGAILLPVVLYAGLARAGVLAWWLVPFSIAPMVLGPMVGSLVAGPAGIVLGTAISLVGFTPTFLVAVRLIRRSRLATA